MRTSVSANSTLANSTRRRCPPDIVDYDIDYIQGRVLLVDNALRPATGDVEVTFHDAKGIRIDRRQLVGIGARSGDTDHGVDLAVEVGVRGEAFRRPQSQSLHHTWPEALEKHIGPTDELQCDVNGGGLLEIQSDGPLPAADGSSHRVRNRGTSRTIHAGNRSA